MNNFDGLNLEKDVSWFNLTLRGTKVPKRKREAKVALVYLHRTQSEPIGNFSES